MTRGNFLHHKSFYTRHLLHQTPFTPNTLYIYRLLHHTFHTKHLLHQAPFTRPQAGRPGWIRASDPNAPYQNCLVVQTAARHSKPPKKAPVSTTPLPHTPSLFSLRSQGETTPSLPAGFRNMILNDHHRPPKTTFNNPRNNQNTRGIFTGEVSQNPNLETFCLKDFLVRAGTILHPPKVPRSRICGAKIPRIYRGDEAWVILLGLPPTSKNEYNTGIDSGTKFHRFKKCRG